MFFHASKVFWFFATPSNLLTCALIFGCVLTLAKRRRRLGFAVTAWTAGAIGLFGILPIANWIALPLEQRFPAFVEGADSFTGIVVLGGVVDAERAFAREQLSVNESADRIIAMTDLARRYPEAKIIFSGGVSTLIADEPAEAAAVQRFLPTLGLSPDRITFETESRNTYENARNIRAQFDPQGSERWLLVTSALHMPRAVGCFRKLGLTVVPYPVNYRTRGTQDIWRPFPAVAAGLGRVDLATKEWVGLVAYYLWGATDQLLPGPR